MPFMPAAPQNVPNRTPTLTAPSSSVWRDLVKSESSYSTNKNRFELKISDFSHLGSTYVPYHLADLMDELLGKTGWRGTNCSYLPFAASRACSLQQFYVHCEHIKPTDSTPSDWNVVHWGTRTVKSLQKPLCSHQFLASKCPVAALCCKRCMIHHPMKSLGLFPQAAARPL